jgi:molybdopterin-guanine dinucleotide biosynthesis protein MobB
MVAIIGRKHHGKTTLTVQLAAELTRRGHRVATIKHGTHTFNIDPTTTDTYRHYHEGQAIKVAMVAPDKFALIERWSEELAPEEIAARYMGDADVVLCEGFKRSALPRIEIFRAAAGAGGRAQPLYDPSAPEARHYLAIVTDADTFSGDVPVIRLSEPAWLAAVADVIEQRIMLEGA